MRPWTNLLVCSSLIVVLDAATAQSIPDKGYLCCNLRIDSGLASDGNQHDPSRQMLPAGTPVIPLVFADERLKFEAKGKEYTLGNDYSRELSPEQFVERWIVKRDPQRNLAKLPPQARQEIQRARVMRGMTREQVAMALGYPTSVNTPDLEAGEWKYQPYSGYDFLVLFDDRGRVRGVQCDDPKTRSAMYSADPALLTRAKPSVGAPPVLSPPAAEQ